MELVVGLFVCLAVVGLFWWATRSTEESTLVLSVPIPKYPHDFPQSSAYPPFMFATERYDASLAELNRKISDFVSLPQKEETPVGSCSAKERITEMRLRALETGQSIDPMEAVREALTALKTRGKDTTAVHGNYHSYTQTVPAAGVPEAIALLEFALERAAPATAPIEQAEAV